MQEFPQVVGEKILYSQSVVGDSISAANWSSSPGGPTVQPVTPDGDTAEAFFSSLDKGTFVLTCALSLASGQVRKGQARIVVD